MGAFMFKEKRKIKVRPKIMDNNNDVKLPTTEDKVKPLNQPSKFESKPLSGRNKAVEVNKQPMELQKFWKPDRISKANGSELTGMRKRQSIDASAECLKEFNCFICGIYTATQDVFTCKSCGKTFHELCLRKMGMLSTESRALMVDRSRTADLSWSCLNCTDLTNLLFKEEIEELKRAVNLPEHTKEIKMTEKEFLAFQMKQENILRQTSKQRKAIAKEEFSTFDKNLDGTINLRAMINGEAIKILARRQKSSLVKLLNQREIDAAYQRFKQVDTDCDGLISYNELKRGFELLYQENDSLVNQIKSGELGYCVKVSREGMLQRKQAICNSTDRTFAVIYKDTDSGSMEEQHLILEEPYQISPGQESMKVNFDQFLEDQSIYIIASRPNFSVANSTVDSVNRNASKAIFSVG